MALRVSRSPVDGCVRLWSEKGKRNGNDEKCWRKGRGSWREGKTKRKTSACAVTWTPMHCVPDGGTNERKWVKDWERRDRSRKLCRVLGPSAYQFPCSRQEIGSLTTVWQRRLLSQSYSVLDGFNLEQLVDDEPIHMVFKSLSISSAINLQDSLHLSSTVTDSSEQIL